MKKINITQNLIGKPEIIQILKASKKVGDYEKHKDEENKTLFYYNGAAKVLDYLLIDKSINAIEILKDASTLIYLEFGDYRLTCGTNREIAYSGEKILKEYYSLIPVVILALSDDFKAQKFKKSFLKVIDEYEKNGFALESTVLEFCTNFKNEVVSNLGNNLEIFNVYQEDLNVEIIKNLVERREVKEISLLKDLKRPDFIFE